LSVSDLVFCRLSEEGGSIACVVFLRRPFAGRIRFHIG